MALVDSLLAAIVRADGDALVLHAGERPYVVAPTGQAELASRELTLEAMTGMVNELLPDAARQSLDEDGAVQHRLAATDTSADEDFTVVAAKGGEDIWIEIRRHRKSENAENIQPDFEEVVFQMEREAEPDVETFEIRVEPEAEPEIEREPEAEAAVELEAEHEIELVVEPEQEVPPPVAPVPPAPMMMPEAARSTPRRVTPPPAPSPDSQTAVVLPISRTTPRSDQAFRVVHTVRSAGIDRLLRIAAAHGASTLYLTSQSKPSIRVDGEISPVEGEPVLSEAEVEAMMLDIIPERNREALRGQAGTEWICDVPEVGRVRCVTFRDHRGAGGIFRMVPARAISPEQLGLSREIQGLCAEAEGLLLITGPRSSGKSTLIAAFVDLINRSRSDHVITLENEITFIHESRLSLVSQRELSADNAEWLTAARAAVRENPDVLVIEDLRTPEIVTLALEAAQSGHLVIGALSAHTATEAVDRILDQTPPEGRPKIQLALAGVLRGVVAQVLLRKIGGGRVAARELLLNTSEVANIIAEGKTSQLPMAIDSGRKHGMVPLNDALASFVQGGVVDSREAYRLASDQSGFVSQLKRQGVDTSFMERLA